MLCKTLSPIINVPADEISEMIERVHRGGKPTLANNNNTNNNNRQSRVIHARLYDWNNVERLKDLMWKRGKNKGIYIDQRFGPNTTWRRNQALVARRELKARGEIAGGFLRYPAKLFVKREGAQNYTLQENFSSVAVPLPEIDA